MNANYVLLSIALFFASCSNVKTETTTNVKAEKTILEFDKFNSDNAKNIFGFTENIYCYQMKLVNEDCIEEIKHKTIRFSLNIDKGKTYLIKVQINKFGKYILTKKIISDNCFNLFEFYEDNRKFISYFFFEKEISANEFDKLEKGILNISSKESTILESNKTKILSHSYGMEHNINQKKYVFATDKNHDYIIDFLKLVFEIGNEEVPTFHY